MILAKLIYAWVMFFKHLFVQSLACSRTVYSSHQAAWWVVWCPPPQRSQQQVSGSFERIPTGDLDMYFGVRTVHIIFLPLRKISGWWFCVFCGFAGGVLCVLLFCSFLFFCSLWQRTYPLLFTLCAFLSY